MNLINNTAAASAASTILPEQINTKTSDNSIAAIASAALNSLQANTKTKPALPAVQAQSDTKERELAISSLMTILKMYDPQLTRENIGFLTLHEIVSLANVALASIPARNNPLLFKEAYKHLQEDTDPSLEAREKCFKNFWKACGVAEPVRNYYTGLFKSISYLLKSNVGMETPLSADPVSIEKRELVQKILFKLLKEYCQYRQFAWDNAAKTIIDVTEKYEQYVEAIPKAKKQIKKANAFKDDDSSFKHVNHLHNVGLPLLRKLCLYVFDRIPKLIFTVSNMDHSMSRTEIQHLASLSERSAKQIGLVAKEFTDELANYEADFSLSSGIPPHSFKAIEIQRKAMIDNETAKAEFYKDIAAFLCEFAKSKECAGSSVKPSQSIVKRIFSIILDVTSETRWNPISELSEFSNQLSKACTNAVTKLKTTVQKNILAFQKDERAVKKRIKNNLEQFQKTLKNWHKTVKFIPSKSSTIQDMLTELANLNFSAEYDSLIKQANDSEYFKLWQMIQFHRVLTKTSTLNEEDQKLLPILRDSKTEETDEMMIAVNELSRLSFVGNYFIKIIESNSCEISKIYQKNQTIQADESIHLLELEEEMAANTKLALELAEKAKKEQLSATSVKPHISIAAAATTKAAVTSIASTVIPKPISSRLPSNLTTSLGKILFDLRNESAHFCDINPADVLPPAAFAGRTTSPAEVAKYQELYSNFGFILSLEMLSQCDQSEKTFMIPLVLEWGYMTIEQAITTEYVKVFPTKFLKHDLNLLMRHLNIQLQNKWTQHAPSYTLYHRYPMYYCAEDSNQLTYALKHLQKGNDETTKEFCEQTIEWAKDAVMIQAAVLAKNCDDASHSNLKKINGLLEEFNKLQSDKNEEAIKEVASTLTKDKRSILKECDVKLNMAYEMLQKHMNAHPKTEKALGNALNHIKSLKGLLKIFVKLPQQKYMHIILHGLISYTKNFSENLGVALSLHRDDGRYTHSLNTYMKEYELGKKLPKKLNEALKMLDLEKGIDYPYKHFAYPSEKGICILMNTLSEFYARSQEALLINEGAVPYGMKEKDVPTLQGELVEYSQTFSDLIHTLATQHLNF